MRPNSDACESGRVDSGSTLLEVLLAAALIGIVAAAIGAAGDSAASTSRSAVESLAASRDIDRLRRNLFQDASEYPDLDDSPTTLSGLPGTNAFTLTRVAQGATPSSSDVGVVSYRYVGNDDAWSLVRFELRDLLAPAESAIPSTVVSGLAAPPESWSPGDRVRHAVSVEAAGTLRSVDVIFESGARLRAAANRVDIGEMPTTTTSTQPVAIPATRCGGSIAVVLNTSSTIWSRGAASTVTNALSTFVDHLRGTASHVRIVAFDRSAFSFYPDVSSGSYVDILQPSTSLTALHSKLTSLSTTSSNWRNGRNWEDGLWQATRRDTGLLLAQPPDLVVFITDGSPNRNRTNTSSDSDTTFHAADLSRAIAAADHARGMGAALVGILMGSGADSTAASRLSSVFGAAAWDGSSNVLPAGRAQTFARPAAEGFSRLGDILRLVAQWRCGGTVTLQQRVLAGGISSIPSDVWSFTSSSDGASQPIFSSVDANRPSAAADFGVGDSQHIRSIVIAQEPRPDHRHVSMSCTSRGAAVPAATSIDADGRTSTLLAVAASDVVSCVSVHELLP